MVREILELKPRTRVEFWTDFKYYKNVTKLTTEIGMAWGDGSLKGRKKGPYIRVRRIPSGKFHRYVGFSLLDYFRHFDVTLRDLIWGNFLGFLGFLGGIITSTKRLIRKKNRPDVIFLKGGYVCLPVGLLARLFRIPYIIHESDAIIGLANRLLIKKAKVVAFGTPLDEETLLEHKNYVWTGIPVGSEFKAVSPTQQIALKKAFSFSTEKPLIVITGGSQGSKNLNQAVRVILPELLKFASVGLVAGRKHYEDMVDLKRYENWEKANLESNFRMWEFNTTMDELLGAADVIVSRAGATTIAEMAGLKKATILVPFERLPGGHQVKNAKRLDKSMATVMILDSKIEKRPEILLKEIKALVRSPRRRADMANRLHEEARADASKRLAEIILETKNG